MALFDHIAPLGLDPVLLSIEQFVADPRRQKVNLGVGMYYDADGRIPLMAAVREAETRFQARLANWGYGVSEGQASLRSGAASLVFGAGHPLIEEGRIATVQTLGGTGALRLGAELLAQLSPAATVALSAPTWSNHTTIFTTARMKLTNYPYYDATTGGLDAAGMWAAIGALAPGSVVVLHACCHNPTGVDLTPAQWQDLAELLVERQLVPFIDLAYQGFADGLDADAYGVRLLAETGLPLFVATSFSKSFALYGERVGALMVVTGTRAQAQLLVDQSKSTIRNMYSTPPAHGGTLVGDILSSPELNTIWRAELEGMRLRIHDMRAALYERLKGANALADFSYIVHQRGLFSYSGLSPSQILRLREVHAIHAISDGRICVAALNPGNLDRVAEAIKEVVEFEGPAA
jgi:aromatic-amino-acid transaminase